MEFVLAVVTGAFIAAAIYLLLSRSVIRMLIGVVVLGNAVGLAILTLGRLTRDVPPIVPEGLLQPETATANPVSQALILTAIVIGFSVFVVLLVLGYRAAAGLGGDDAADMRLAEPETPPRVPLSY